MTSGIDTNGYPGRRRAFVTGWAVDRHVVVVDFDAAASNPGRSHVRNESEDKPMIGYAAAERQREKPSASELEVQTERIVKECEARHLSLLHVVREEYPRASGAMDRPELCSALHRVSHGEAGGLVVADLSSLARSVPELGCVLSWLRRGEARLIAASEGVDSAEQGGSLALSTLIRVAGWPDQGYGQPVVEPIRRPSRRGAPDPHQLGERIAGMLGHGMSLQAVADRLNAEGVPTVRGGVTWHASSVLATAHGRSPPTA